MATELTERENEAAPVMEVRNVEKHFDPSSNVIEKLRARLSPDSRSKIRAVDGVDLTLEKEQVQGVIGESGCGKSTLLLTLIGEHLPSEGELLYKGNPVSEFSKADWKQFRREVQIIFQDPFNAINPHFTVRQTLKEPLRIHNIDQTEERIREVLEQVQLRPAEQYIDRHESELSGGEKQRVAIARALIVDPEVILADEPVSMLDVSTQASVLELLEDLTTEYGASMMYVSHDLSTVSYVCDRVNVMYLGRLVEKAPTKEIINNPKHPYTQALIRAIPIPDPHFEREWTQIKGAVGDAQDLPTGCRFKDRCPERMDICDERPLLRPVDGDGGHEAACHLYYDHEDVVAASATDGHAGVDAE